MCVLPTPSLPPSLPPFSLSPSLLSSQEYFVDYLEGHPLLVCQELLVMFLISRHRHIEALALHEKIRPLAEVGHHPYLYLYNYDLILFTVVTSVYKST